ncbi:DASH family cryptochrome [Fibrella forsythiae]|uniref:Cryptochrome DASH n=1 Tax=Fibrella forsythiae TaxID=2817061 RepID=A0ABS3JHF4_9BACT|nr:DASH family cryptochrome [Fibrella forsythiae]MBO0948332.1 DASH family cryptochrome [Fibrella forsythiae]
MSSPNRILYWFRSDLRLHDNPALTAACTEAAEVLPVYVFDPAQFRELPKLGLKKTGIFRANFLLESVADLRQSLRARGADLIIRVGDPAQILADMAEEINARAVYASKEVTSEETDVESALSKRLKPLNIDIELFWSSTLYHIRDLPFGIAKLPDVFTQFRTRVEKEAQVRELDPTPDQVVMPTGIKAGDLPTLEQLGFTETLQTDNRAAISFKGGESVALARLEHYLWTSDLIRTYKATRNGMLGEAYSSKFSAWLAHGCLSPRFIYHEIKRYEQDRGGNESTYWLIFELIWRDFFRFVALRFGSRLFKPSGIKHALKKQWNHDPDLFQRWARGETGIPLIDANMRELNATGFMSNRGRQNVASFLVNDLGLNWTWGAAYFESLLIDYDPCSNWGNWNYVAGVGNDPREAPNGQPRYFNIYSQATRYDEQGLYVKHWLPELANVPGDKVHLVSELTQQQQAEFGVGIGDTYPIPMVDPIKWQKNR